MRPDICPECAADLTGEPIPEASRQAGSYGPPETAPTHFSRLIMIEVRGVYDGGLYFVCPDCGVRFHRWPEGHPLRAKAEEYVSGGRP